MKLTRRTFLLGACAVPIAAKAAAVESLLPAPVSVTTYADISQRTAMWAGTDMMDHFCDALRYGMAAVRIERGQVRRIEPHSFFLSDYRNAAT